jgi:hypothetical protein
LKRSTSPKILLGISLMCIFSMAFMSTAQAYVYMHAESYQIIKGHYISGSIYSTFSDNEYTLDVKASHWWFFRYFYTLQVDFEMETHKYDNIVVDFTDNIGDTVIFRVYYTDGSSEDAGEAQDGLHMFAIDDTKYLDRIRFVWGGDSYAWQYIAYYIYIDWVAATPI